MTILKFWQLSIKSFFAPPQWEVAIINKIFLGLFAAYMFAYILALGVSIYYILGRTFPILKLIRTPLLNWSPILRYSYTKWCLLELYK